MLCLLALSVGASPAQPKKEIEQKIIAQLNSEDERERSSALLKLYSGGELSEPVLKKVIDCLDDLRTPFAGRTVASEAAKVIAEQPRQAARAIPQLLKLLKVIDNYGEVSASAAQALATIDRPILETYLIAQSAEQRKTLATNLTYALSVDAGHLAAWGVIAEIIAMLGADASNAVPTLEAKNTQFRGKNFSSARVLEIRTEAALQIITNRWRTGEAAYPHEMRRADTALGKPDPYVIPANRFTNRLEVLLKRMKAANISKAFILRKEDTFPFRPSDGLPLAKIIRDSGYSYLSSDDGRGSQLPNIPLIVLSTASESVYRSFRFPSSSPAFSPMGRDFAFIEIGVNGEDSFSQTLKSLGIQEGYREDTVYEFWPSELWPDKGEIGGAFRIPDKVRMLWIVVTDGKVINGAYRDK